MVDTGVPVQVRPFPRDIGVRLQIKLLLLFLEKRREGGEEKEVGVAEVGVGVESS